MRGVLMLFMEKDEADPEKFGNPNITDVKIKDLILRKPKDYSKLT